MLIKDICKQCYDENRTTPWDKHSKKDKSTGKRYNPKDRTWKKGRMYCIALMDRPGPFWPSNHCMIDINEPPPTCCYYLVEQLMKAAENKDSES